MRKVVNTANLLEVASKALASKNRSRMEIHAGTSPNLVPSGKTTRSCDKKTVMLSAESPSQKLKVELVVGLVMLTGVSRSRCVIEVE